MTNENEWTLDSVNSCDDYETVEAELEADGYSYFAGTSRVNCDFDGADCVQDIFEAADEIVVRQPWKRMDEWDDDDLLYAYSVPEDDCTNWFLEKGREAELRKAFIEELRNLLKNHPLPKTDIEPDEEDLNIDGRLVHYISIAGEERFSPCIVRTYKRYLRNHHRPTSNISNKEIKAYLLRLGDECFREIDGVPYSFIAVDPEEVTDSLKKFGRKPKAPEPIVGKSDWCMPGRPGLGEVKYCKRLMIFGNRVLPELLPLLKGVRSLKERKRTLESLGLEWEYAYLSLYGKRGWFAVKPTIDFKVCQVGERYGNEIYLLRYCTIQSLLNQIEGDLIVSTPLLDTVPQLRKLFNRSIPFEEIKARLSPYNPVWHVYESTDDAYSKVQFRVTGSGFISLEKKFVGAFLKEKDYNRLLIDISNGKFKKQVSTISPNGFLINPPGESRFLRKERHTIDLAGRYEGITGKVEIAFYHPCEWDECMGFDVQGPSWRCREPYRSLVAFAREVIEGQEVDILESMGKGLFSIERKEEEPAQFSSRFLVSAETEAKILAGVRQWFIERIDRFAFEGRNCRGRANVIVSFAGRTWMSSRFMKVWESSGLESSTYSIKDFAHEIGKYNDFGIGKDILSVVDVPISTLDKMEIPFCERYKAQEGEELGTLTYSRPPRKKRLVWFDNKPIVGLKDYCSETNSFKDIRQMLRRLGAQWEYGTLDASGRKGWWAWMERNLD